MINTDMLRDICDRKGIRSSSELAIKSGIHRNTANAIFAGKISPFSNSFLKIAEFLEVNPKELVSDDDVDSFEAQVKDSILKNLKEDLDIAYFIFGSRASKTARRYSDLDIGISGGMDRVESERFLELKEKFSELFEDLPINVDLSNFDDAPDWFLCDLKQDPIFLTGDIKDYYFIQGYISGKKAR